VADRIDYGVRTTAEYDQDVKGYVVAFTTLADPDAQPVVEMTYPNGEPTDHERLIALEALFRSLLQSTFDIHRP
jgi:hypothetical protein